MPVYSYTARDADGALVTGSTAGATEAFVRRQLRDNGLYLVSLTEHREREGLGSWYQRMRGVKLGDMVIFSQQLSTMVSAGLPILECLHELVGDTESVPLRRALTQIAQDIQAGSTFSQAMSRHPRVFSDLYVALVQAGETGGVLEQSLDHMAQNLDREMELREKVKSAFVYPVVVLTVAAGVVTFMLLFVIPVFQKVYAQFHHQLPGPTRLLMAVSGFISHYWWLALLMVAGLVFGFRAFIATERGRALWDRTKLRLPLFGRLIRKMTVTRFVRTLGALVSAGVPILAALETASRVAANVEFTQAVKGIAEEVARGGTLSAAIRASGRFPTLVSRLTQVGEESGNLDSMLDKLATYFDRDIEHHVRRLVTLMEPVLTLVLGGIVGSIVVALYMPIFTLAAVIRR